MVAAMVLGGLRRCEVLGLRLEDLRVAERRVFVADGKGGHQRLVPVSGRFFAAVGAYLEVERPADGRHRPGVRGPQGAHPRTAVDAQPGWTRSSTVPAAAPAWRTRPATSCDTPV